MDTSQLPNDQFATVGSLNIRFWETGEHEIPVILVHGLGGYAENWMFNISELAEHFKVYVPDLPGFGKSDKPEAPYDYDYFAEFVRDFMNAMHINKAHLVGHSLGGGIALQFAITYPEKINKLVLVGSAGLGKDISMIHRMTSLPILGEQLTKPNRKNISGLYKSLVYDNATITEKMKTNTKYIRYPLPGIIQKIILALMIILFTDLAYGDILPENHHFINKCVKITNLNEYPSISLIGKVTSMDGNSYCYLINSYSCLDKGYKYNELDIYAARKNYLQGKNIEDYNPVKDINALRSNVHVNPWGGFYHDSLPVSGIDEFYRIMGFTDSSVVLHKWKEIVHFNNGRADSVKTFKFHASSLSLYQEFPPLGITVYPNPTDDHFYIKTNNLYTGKIQVNIYSISGKCFKSYLFTKNGRADQYYIPTYGLPSGEYFLKLSLGEMIEKRKIIIN